MKWIFYILRDETYNFKTCLLLRQWAILFTISRQLKKPDNWCSYEITYFIAIRLLFLESDLSIILLFTMTSDHYKMKYWRKSTQKSCTDEHCLNLYSMQCATTTLTQQLVYHGIQVNRNYQQQLGSQQLNSTSPLSATVLYDDPKQTENTATAKISRVPVPVMKIIAKWNLQVCFLLFSMHLIDSLKSRKISSLVKAC